MNACCLDTDPPGYTSYTIEYSPLNGMLSSISSWKAKAETVYWSDATFAMWQAVTSFTRTNIKNLRYIGRIGVENEFTNSIIRRALLLHSGNGQVTAIKTFAAGTPPFLALLGTPNGVGPAHLLMTHKQWLGHKSIAQVVLFEKSQEEYPAYPDLFFVVRDVPPRILSQEANMNSLQGKLPACLTRT